MVPIILILVAVALIIAIDVPALLRGKSKKELWIFSILLLFGTLIGIAEALHIGLPNPLDGIIYIYNPVSHLLDTWLK
ncbi:hypothetical protein AB4Z17_25825 [Paenibacillus sp. TAF43_2]|uniref:hypothetical protein n=1 Tax=Paenibacillus sp. TAF43_2 TaxID=3233069 RepID=UPI003F9AD720